MQDVIRTWVQLDEESADRMCWLSLFDPKASLYLLGLIDWGLGLGFALQCVCVIAVLSGRPQESSLRFKRVI